MEGSKAFAKDFMSRHKIPTAAFKTFTASAVEEAINYVKTCGHQVVLKASGLAAGKGVLIPETEEETITGLREIMVDNVFGSAGLRLFVYIIVMVVKTICIFFLFHIRQRSCY